jgi:tRNA1(Val) A37 N6-methylase TrmN6
LERQYQNIRIKDEAFQSLFDFFDKWEWHLDTRVSASGNDINPDVLGYIFEQYINDRAQMGAYYTKEDITEYIGRNTIIPFLLNKVKETSSEKSFAPDGEVWKMLQKSGTTYIYDAAKHGYSTDWKERLPKEISIGLDTTQPDLLQRRSHWNEKTDEEFALPTEIWRETIDRLKRCDEIKNKIETGAIHEVNDFITYNLNLRSFTYDLLANTEDHLLVEHFYHALQKITILDPTCGSGAFLFAAMNILEPLYEICIDRMESFHEQNKNLFKDELGEISNKYRSNIQYFIYKSIILRNLYGVDIMVEATEIAKLRLFLKMVAVVEVDKRAENMGLDPLPDIDFNIRCGNTLVGYATEQQLNDAINYGDAFAKAELKNKVDDAMDRVAFTYKTFKWLQINQSDNMSAYKEAKKELKERLASLNEVLNRHLYRSTSNQPYEEWLKNTQPFHWIAEFYDIIKGEQGFDVIIGNPPYVEYNKKVKGLAISDLYKLENYKTLSCGNMYAYVMERSKEIMAGNAYISMIVPLSGHSTERMAPLVTNFYEKFGLHLHLNLSADAHPQKLFEGVKFRLSIFFVTNNGEGRYSTKYTRWQAEERKFLFQALIHFNNIEDYQYQNIIPKIPSPLFINIVKKINADKTPYFINIGNYKCLYHNTPVNWIRSHSFVPYFCSERDGKGVTTQLKTLTFNTTNKVKVGSAILNSSLFFIWWICNSDCYHLNKPELSNFKYNYDKAQENIICKISDDLADDMQKKSVRRVYNYKTSGRVEYDEFYMKLSKPIIDEIDKVLAKHYGFTEEELDFIINYDIKYRMGDELNEK